MPGNGNGNGGNGDGTREGQRTVTREEYEAALAAMAATSDPDRLDRLALFAMQQSDSLMRAIKAMADVIALFGERFALLEGEIARLRAQRVGPSEDGGGHLQ